MKAFVIFFTVLMVICIAGMLYYSQNDRVFSLFSAASLLVTLAGTYCIERNKKQNS